MFNGNHVCAIAAMAAISMVSLTACSDESLNITNVPDESELSSSSMLSVEPGSSSSSELSSSSAKVSKPRDCDAKELTVGSVCVRKERDPVCGFKASCGDGIIENEYVYMGDGVFDTFYDIAHKAPCTAENENSKQKLTYGDEFFQKSEYYMCLGGFSEDKAMKHPDEDPMVYEWFQIKEAEYYCAVKYSDSEIVSAAPAGDVCSFETLEGKQNYLSVYNPNTDVEKMVWEKFEPKSELGPCPTEYFFNRLFSKSGEKVYKCYLGEWVLAEGMMPQQYLDPRKDNLTDEEYDVLELPQNASVGDRAAGLLEDCVYHKEFSYFLCNSEQADSYISNCWMHKRYDDCEPRNYYRYRENGSWTLETDEDRLNDSRFQLPDCSEEYRDSTFEVPPRPGKPGEVYRCLWLPNVLGGGNDKLADYVFHRAEKSKMF